MKKNYTLLLMLFIICIFQEVQAQQVVDSDTARAQNVYVELGGQGIALSANYDTRFSNKRNGLGGRIGIGFIGGDGNNITTIPVGLNYLIGNGKSFFEVGLGATYFSAKFNNHFFDKYFNNFIGTASFSYRFQPLKSGFSFRGGITPLFGSEFLLPYYGISLGYTFFGKQK
jgi:hypothetical protein